MNINLSLLIKKINARFLILLLYFGKSGFIGIHYVKQIIVIKDLEIWRNLKPTKDLLWRNLIHKPSGNMRDLQDIHNVRCTRKKIKQFILT